MSNELPENVRRLLAVQNKSRITYVISPSGPDGSFKINSDDLSNETKEVANAMAVGLTTDAKNTYQISTEKTEVQLINDNGIPSAISDEAPGGADGKTFLSQNAYAKDYFVRISEPGIYNSTRGNYSIPNNRVEEEINVIKGKAIVGEGDLNYTEQLEAINLIGSSARLVKKIGDKLQGSNTYYPAPSATGDGKEYSKQGTLENESNIGRAIIQKNIGSYQRTLDLRDQGTAIPTTVLTSTDFKALGLQIPLRATGELYIPKFGNNQTDQSPGEQIIGARAAALAPGLARLGLRIPVNDITAISTLDNDFNGVLKPDKKLNKNSNFPDLATEEINSYGSYNNWIAPFDGIERILQMPALAIQVGAIAIIVVAIAEILQGITGKDTYADQVRAGFISFFGLQSPLGADRYDGAAFVAAVATAIFSSRMLNETGWYGTVVRGFIKNLFQEISRGAFAIAVTANVSGDTSILNRTGVDIYSDGLDGDVIGAAAKIIELFFNSKLVGFTNMLAQIGEDQVTPRFNTDAPTYQPRKKALGSTPYFSNHLTANQKSFIDSLVDGTEVPNTSPILDGAVGGNKNIQIVGPNVSKLIFKDRLNNSQRKGAIRVKPTAWGTGTTPSLHLLPETIKKAALAAGGQDGLNKLAPYSELISKDSISRDDIDNIENALNASYMPFYIQDMRTGEILSFHAFIENINDGFTAQYESENSFGRPEQTHVYKSTNREMGLSFWIVSTNPQDHDEMWFKINKLVTLVYPQYTAGRPLELANGQKFVQPFSQLIGAGPLVRLRLGDIWSTNYSRFNVMRLFGLGKASFNLDESSAPDQPPNTNYTNLNTQAGISPGTDYNRILEEMLRGELSSGQQILMYFSKDMDNRVFGARVSNNVLREAVGDPSKLASILTGDAPRELYVPDLEPGVYTLKVSEPRMLGPISQYNIEIVSPNVGNNPKSGYVLRYANRDNLDPNELSLFDQLGEAFQARFSAFEGTPTEDLWRRSVAYSSLSTKLTVDYDWLATTYPPYTYNSAINSSITNVRQTIQNFFKINDIDTNNNPIMQAFENNRGMGIAGFISQLTFDWNTGTWETEWSEKRPNSRAPQWAKIDIRFLPIHDIAPGIDSDGFITAPVYPVGRYSQALKTIESIDKTRAESDGEATGAAAAGATPGTSP